MLDILSKTVQQMLVTMLLGISGSAKMRADLFVNPLKLMTMGLGLVIFVFGAASISAFSLSARVVHRMSLE